MAQKPLHVPDGIDGHKKSEQADDDEKKSGQEVEPEMKGKIGKSERQDGLVNDAGRNGPYSGCGNKKRSDCGEGKTGVDKNTLPQTQERDKRKQKNERGKSRGYETYR